MHMERSWSFLLSVHRNDFRLHTLITVNEGEVKGQICIRIYTEMSLLDNWTPGSRAGEVAQQVKCVMSRSIRVQVPSTLRNARQCGHPPVI